MEIKKLYNREKRYLVLILIPIISLLLLICSYFYTLGKRDKFDSYIKNGDYSSIYDLIKSPDFTQNIFIEYFKYNFGQKPQLINITKDKNQISYKFNTPNGERVINLKRVKGELTWEFNDYVYNWKMKVQSGAKIYIEDMELKNENGEVNISRIPEAVYGIKANLRDVGEFEQRVMAGQSIEIKMNIKENAMGKCKEVIENFLRFKEKASNTGIVEDIKGVDKKSGVYAEIVDEVNWLKSADYKLNKKLIEFNITNSRLNGNEKIELNVMEKWEITIKTDVETSKKTEIFSNTYTIEPGADYIITQLKTN